MTLKVTERDKKLLAVLAVFVIIIGIGAGVILPLMDKGQELSGRLAEEKIARMENEQKVHTLDAMKKKNAIIKEQLEGIQKEFYPVTPSMEIDRMLTGMALSHGILVTDLDIKMPDVGIYAQLLPYQESLRQIIENEEENLDELEGTAYPGVYTAVAEIIMTGSREALQAMLDECAALEPKGRIVEFLWEKEGKDGGNYLLSMTVALYMGEDTQKYIDNQARKESAETQEEAEADENLQ